MLRLEEPLAFDVHQPMGQRLIDCSLQAVVLSISLAHSCREIK